MSHDPTLLAHAKHAGWTFGIFHARHERHPDHDDETLIEECRPQDAEGLTVLVQTTHTVTGEQCWSPVAYPEDDELIFGFHEAVDFIRSGAALSGFMSTYYEPDFMMKGAEA